MICDLHFCILGKWGRSDIDSSLELRVISLVEPVNHWTPLLLLEFQELRLRCVVEKNRVGFGIVQQEVHDVELGEMIWIVDDSVAKRRENHACSLDVARLSVPLLCNCISQRLAFDGEQRASRRFELAMIQRDFKLAVALKDVGFLVKSLDGS